MLIETDERSRKAESMYWLQAICLSDGFRFTGLVLILIQCILITLCTDPAFIPTTTVFYFDSYFPT